MNTHKVNTTSELHRIEELISGGSLDEANSALRRLRATLIQGMNLQEKTKLYLLSTKLCIARGEYKRALVKARTVLRMADRTDDHTLYAEAKHDLGRILFRLGRSAEAEQELIESYAFYRRVRQGGPPFRWVPKIERDGVNSGSDCDRILEGVER